jgi:hypothetical protein
MPIVIALLILSIMPQWLLTGLNVTLTHLKPAGRMRVFEK